MNRERLSLDAGDRPWPAGNGEPVDRSALDGRLVAPPYRSVRAVLRSACLVLWTIITFATWGVFDLGFRIVSCGRIPWRYRVFRVWSRWALRILGTRVRVRGNRPRGPFFLVANHLSYLDVPVLASLLHATFIAKQEISSWPVMGFLTRAMGTIFVNRHRKLDVYRVNQVIQQRMQKGESLVLFPEGTSTDGGRIEPFHSPLLDEPVVDNWPVHAVSLSYTVREPDVHARNTVCYWGDMEFFNHAWTLLKLDGIDVELEFSEHPLDGDCRKQLAPRLEETVRVLYH